MLRGAAVLMKVERAQPPAASRKSLFDRLARWTERQTGRSLSFASASALVVIWAVSGPLFGWSDTWQLVINTGTTIVTFLMVFLIQNAHSRDTRAINLKLDELIRTSAVANQSVIAAEQLSDHDLEALLRLARSAAWSRRPEPVVYSRVADSPLAGPDPVRGQIN
jgi:low affinity Fe/Cu permease